MGLRVCVSVLSLQFAASSVASEVPDGSLAYASWECAAIGFFSKSFEQLSEPLFQQGFSILSDTLNGIASGDVDENVLEDFPVGILWRLNGGPSVDFQLGALWTHFQNDANDLTWPDFERSTFEEQKDFQEMTADTEFRNRNCQHLGVQ